MKYFDSIKYLVITILLINASFYLMALFGESKMLTSQQTGDEINLIPLEGFIRGSINISETQRISNWRNNKNSAHWKFVCTKNGAYKIQINHNRVSKELEISTAINGQQFDQKLQPKSTQTLMGKIELTEGIHGLALFAHDIPKKSKLPEISSVNLIKIK